MNRPPSQTKLSDAKWGDVKAEMRAVLIDVARARQTITYSELCLRLTTARLHYHSHLLTRLLGEVCGEALEQGDGLLCALVVAKQTGIPSGGYFNDLRGADPADLEAAWRADLESVFALWSSR